MIGLYSPNFEDLVYKLVFFKVAVTQTFDALDPSSDPYPSAAGRLDLSLESLTEGLVRVTADGIYFLQSGSRKQRLTGSDGIGGVEPHVVR